MLPAGELQESASDGSAVQKLFSADDHVIEHARVWTDRLPAKYQEAGPHVVFNEGKESWVHEGQVGQDVGFGSALHSLRDSKVALEPRFELPKTYADMLPGCYDPAQRSKDMLENGVVASVCFPTLPRFGGTLFFEFKDKALADLCVKAYNDFILDEWCPGGVDGMFVPMTICQLWDVEKAVEEVTRCVERGARAITIPENTVYFGLPSFYTDYFDPLWRTCEDADIAICMHLATAGNYADFRPAPEAPHAAMVASAASTMPVLAFTNLVFSPICTKFPGLKFVLSESGLGWIPYAIEKADSVWGRYKVPQNLFDLKPSDIWRNNIFVCQVEETNLDFLDDLGPEKVLWELDYPHPDTVWPHSQTYSREVFEKAGLSQEHVDMITHKNSEALFRWIPAEMPAPAVV